MLGLDVARRERLLEVREVPVLEAGALHELLERANLNTTMRAEVTYRARARRGDASRAHARVAGIKMARGNTHARVGRRGGR